jgi:hypothetical protein
VLLLFYSPFYDAIRCTHYAAQVACNAIGTNNNWNLIDQIYNDIFTINPIPPKSPDIINLATLIYDSQDYSLLPILADALEEQGYPVNHLRDTNMHHYRDCDLIDQILGLS